MTDRPTPENIYTLTLDDEAQVKTLTAQTL